MRPFGAQGLTDDGAAWVADLQEITPYRYLSDGPARHGSNPVLIKPARSMIRRREVAKVHSIPIGWKLIPLYGSAVDALQGPPPVSRSRDFVIDTPDRCGNLDNRSREYGTSIASRVEVASMPAPNIVPRRLFPAISISAAFVLAAVLTVTTEPPSAAAQSVEAGRFVWRDLLTRDVSAAKRFYEELFGWRFEDTTRG